LEEPVEKTGITKSFGEAIGKTFGLGTTLFSLYGAEKYYYDNSDSSSEFWASTSLEAIHIITVYGVTTLAASAGVVCGPGAPVCSTVFAIGGAYVAEQYIAPYVVDKSSKGLDYLWKKFGW